MDIAIKLLRIALAGLIGFLVAQAIVRIVLVVRDRITAENLGKYGRAALASDERTKDFICEAIEIEVAKHKGNVLSLTALRNGQKVANIQLRGAEVADDICKGMCVAI